MRVSQLTLRQEFIRDLFQEVRDHSYAFLKYFYPTQYQIPEKSDLDILIDKQDIEVWKRSIQTSPHKEKAVFTQKSFALFVEVYFSDGSFLEIDLLFSCKWKFNVFLRAEEVLKESKLNLEGIKIASLPHSYAYLCLFYTLNSCRIPQKYQDFFYELDAKAQGEIQSYLEERYELPDLSQDFFDLLPHRPHIIQHIKTYKENKGIPGLLLKLKSIKDRLKDPGLTLTFSGVDGAGKSTVLEQTRVMLTEKYRQEVVLLRQRPSLLPILSSYKYGKQAAEQKAANTLPRMGTNKSKLSSLIRFLYYYLDYLFGQYYVFVQHNLRGHILLYDRYYFDYIVDSKRANIVLSPKFIKLLYRFVFKPELNFLLYAHPDIILARKQELSREDIVSLTDKFTGLFAEFDERFSGSAYIPINNLDLQETMDTIEGAYLGWIAEKE